MFALLAATAPAGGFGWDGAVTRFLDALAPVSSDDVHIDPLVSGATWLVSGAIVVYAILLARAKRVRAVLAVATAIAGAVLLSTVVKELVRRPPIEGTGYSFPSGSATWAAAAVAAIALTAPAPWRRRVAVVGAAFVVVYCGVLTWEQWHYPSDVVAGWCLAVAWAIVAWTAAGRPRADPDAAR